MEKIEISFIVGILFLNLGNAFRCEEVNVFFIGFGASLVVMSIVYLMANAGNY